MKRLKIKSEHHRGRMVELAVVLCDLALHQGYDGGSPYDEMMAASEYIRELEDRIEGLEKELEPYKELERRVLATIDAMGKKQKEHD